MSNMSQREFDFGLAIHDLIDDCHNAAIKAGWYKDPKTGEPITRNLGEMMALEHSEISERLEAVRKNLMSDKIPEYTGEEEECADLLIRLFDYAGNRKLRLGSAYIAKRQYNEQRADHKLENRNKEGGKAF